MKILYFEGVGMDYEQNNLNQSDVLNHRIRTSFYNNDSEQIYLELSNTYMRDKKGKATEKMGTWIDFCFKVSKEKGEDIMYHEIFDRTKEHLELAKMDYTKENITNWINENLNCSFDTIEVLDDFHGYRVHGDNKQYKLMEEHSINHELAKKRKEAYNKVNEEYKKLTNSKYSVISLLDMDNDSITVRCHASDKALGKYPRIKKIKINK
jgi:hypothetical protein